MANSSPSEVVIEYDNSGDSLQDVSQYVLSINDIDIENVTEEVHTFGDSWDEHLPIGLARMPAIEISGLYDDTASVGPDALFKRAAPETPASDTRSLKVTWRSGKTTTVETFVLSYRRSADRSALTKYTVRLQPTGSVTEA